MHCIDGLTRCVSERVLEDWTVVCVLLCVHSHSHSHSTLHDSTIARVGGMVRVECREREDATVLSNEKAEPFGVQLVTSER